MHIGIDASRAQMIRPTGTETYAHHLIGAILGLSRPHEYTLYLRAAEIPAPFRTANACLRTVRPARLWTQLGLSIEMLRRAPDALFVPAHVLPLYRPRHTVVTVHDLGYLFYPASHGRRRWWYLHLSTRFHVQVATRLIADSNATKSDLVKCYAADPAKITVVHLGVDEAFRPVTDAVALAAARARYAGGRDYFLYLGTVQPRKNVAGLLKAYAALRPRRRDCPTLVIAGNRGWLAKPIYALAEALDFKDTVNFVDYVPQDDLPALLSGAVALAQPSFYEGFGLPVLEAMACGAPVVAANTSALPEVVGDAGLLVNPHDPDELAAALNAVLSDPALRAELRQKGLARAAQFSWQRTAEETLRVIEESGKGRTSSVSYEG